MNAIKDMIALTFLRRHYIIIIIILFAQIQLIKTAVDISISAGHTRHVRALTVAP